MSSLDTSTTNIYIVASHPRDMVRARLHYHTCVVLLQAEARLFVYNILIHSLQHKVQHGFYVVALLHWIPKIDVPNSVSNPKTTTYISMSCVWLSVNLRTDVKKTYVEKILNCILQSLLIVLDAIINKMGVGHLSICLFKHS